MFKLREDMENSKYDFKDLKFTKNDNKRVRFRCKECCEWEAYCRKFPKEEYWQLRKVIDNHSCSREYNVKIMTTKSLSKRIQNS